MIVQYQKYPPAGIFFYLIIFLGFALLIIAPLYLIIDRFYQILSERKKLLEQTKAVVQATDTQMAKKLAVYETRMNQMIDNFNQEAVQRKIGEEERDNERMEIINQNERDLDEVASGTAALGEIIHPLLEAQARQRDKISKQEDTITKLTLALDAQQIGAVNQAAKIQSLSETIEELRIRLDLAEAPKRSDEAAEPRFTDLEKTQKKLGSELVKLKNNLVLEKGRAEDHRKETQDSIKTISQSKEHIMQDIKRIRDTKVFSKNNIRAVVKSMRRLTKNAKNTADRVNSMSQQIGNYVEGVWHKILHEVESENMVLTNVLKKQGHTLQTFQTSSTQHIKRLKNLVLETEVLSHSHGFLQTTFDQAFDQDQEHGGDVQLIPFLNMQFLPLLE